jgi:hypothetical protein
MVISETSYLAAIGTFVVVGDIIVDIVVAQRNDRGSTRDCISRAVQLIGNHPDFSHTL